MAKLTLALYQHESRPGDKEAQALALDAAAAQAAGQGADLLITPELFMAGYNIGARAHELAEPAGGPFHQTVARTAKAHGVAILYGYAERAGEVLYNSAAMVDAEGTTVFNFRKLHASGTYEKTTYTLGDELLICTLKGVTIAPLVCYDVEIPEMVRACVLKGADVICAPTAQRAQYAYLVETMIPTRAFENGCYVAYVNYAGSEGDFVYCGMSLLAGPDGTIVSAGGGQEILIAEVDTDVIARTRAQLPYLEDLRPDLYGQRKR